MNTQIDQLTTLCRTAESRFRNNSAQYRNIYSKLIVDNQDNRPHCDVCLGESESDDSGDNFLVCKLCNCLTHVSCYGARFNTYDQDFLCIRCAYLISKGLDYNKVRCVFCPELKGILKPIDATQLDREWAHRTCGNYIVGCWWDDLNPLGPLSFTKEYKKQESTLPCQVCESKYGRTMKCDNLTSKGCSFMAHVTCYIKVGIIRNWVDMRQQSEEYGYNEDTFVTIILCFEHLQKNKLRFRNANQQFDALHQGIFYYEDMNHPARNNYMNSLAFKDTFKNRYIQVKAKRTSAQESNDESSSQNQHKSQSQCEVDKDSLLKLAPYFMEVERDELNSNNKKLKTFIETHFKDKSQASNFMIYGMGQSDQAVESNNFKTKLSQIKKIKKKQNTKPSKKVSTSEKNTEVSVTDIQYPIEKSNMDLEKSKRDENSIIEQRSKDISHLMVTPHFPQNSMILDESMMQPAQQTQTQTQYQLSQQTQPPQQTIPQNTMIPLLSQTTQQTPSKQLTQEAPSLSKDINVPPPPVNDLSFQQLSPPPSIPPPPPTEPEIKKRTKIMSSEIKSSGPSAQMKQVNNMLNQTYNQLKFIQAHRNAQRDDSSEDEDTQPDKAAYVFNLKVQIQYLKTLKAILTEKAISDGLM